MKHSWKLECTIDAFIDMVIEQNPEIKQLASIVKKCNNWYFRYEHNCFSDDEYSTMLPILRGRIKHIFGKYAHSWELEKLMNPHMRAIYNRRPKWLASKLGITEASAQALKNKCWSEHISITSIAHDYFMAIYCDMELPAWRQKDIKKYFKENE